MINTILFDLDGTLTDPKIGITKSVKYSLNKFGIMIENLNDLNRFIGPPLKESFMDFYSFSEQKATQAIDYYREYFSEYGLYENEVYHGIPEMLQILNDKGIQVAVATSKPTHFAKKILEHFKMDQYFSEIIGSNLDNSRTSKIEIIEYTLEKLKKKNTESIMIGDRKHDIIGAKANFVKSIGVLYGYGDQAEMDSENPDYIANNVNELGEIINKLIAV